MLMGMITPRANRPWVEAITSLARMGLSPTTCAYAISKSSCKGSEFSVRLLILRVSNLNEVEEAFATRVAQQAGALLVSGDPTFFAWRERLATLAAHHAVPAIYLYREIVEAGGLMSYAMSIVEAYRTVGTYAARGADARLTWCIADAARHVRDRRRMAPRRCSGMLPC
jgi:hypothetical protein